MAVQRQQVPQVDLLAVVVHLQAYVTVRHLSTGTRINETLVKLDITALMCIWTVTAPVACEHYV